MSIIFDLDAVLRNISKATYGKTSPPVWHWRKGGKNIFTIVGENYDVLLNAEPTKYYDIVRKLVNPVTILSCQPKEWRVYTKEWVRSHFQYYNLLFCLNHEEKEKWLYANPDYILIDDYPKFEDYSRIAVVDYPYNKKVWKPHIRIKTVADMQSFINKHLQRRKNANKRQRDTKPVKIINRTRYTNINGNRDLG